MWTSCISGKLFLIRLPTSLQCHPPKHPSTIFHLVLAFVAYLAHHLEISSSSDLEIIEQILGQLTNDGYHLRGGNNLLGLFNLFRREGRHAVASASEGWVKFIGFFGGH